MINIALDVAGTVLASSGDDSGSLSLIFLLSGPVFFMTIYTIYRNKNKRHYHESETDSVIENVTGVDQQTGRVRGVSNSKIKGENTNQLSGKRN